MSDFFFTFGNDTGILITNAQSEIFYLQITGAQFRHVNGYHVNKSISIHECTCSLRSCDTSHIVRHLVQCSRKISQKKLVAILYFVDHKMQHDFRWQI
jgi:hypothetical protein